MAGGGEITGFETTLLPVFCRFGSLGGRPGRGALDGPGVEVEGTGLLLTSRCDGGGGKWSVLRPVLSAR